MRPLLAPRCVAGLGLGMVHGAANAAGAAAPNPERFFPIVTTAALAPLAAFFPAVASLDSRFGSPAIHAAALIPAGAPFLDSLGAGARVTMIVGDLIPAMGLGRIVSGRFGWAATGGRSRW